MIGALTVTGDAPKYGFHTSVEVLSVPISTQFVPSGVTESTHGLLVVFHQHSPANAAPLSLAGAELPLLQLPIERNAALRYVARLDIGNGEPGTGDTVACDASAGEIITPSANQIPATIALKERISNYPTICSGAPSSFAGSSALMYSMSIIELCVPVVNPPSQVPVPVPFVFK